jgi:Zn finger protein HypA/HybF involved in hydrogenase expression
VNKGLITVLALTLVVACGVWIYRATRPADYAVQGGEMTLYCAQCGEIKVPVDDVKREGWNFLCTKCGQYSATVQKEPTDTVAP